MDDTPYIALLAAVLKLPPAKPVRFPRKGVTPAELRARRLQSIKRYKDSLDPEIKRQRHNAAMRKYLRKRRADGGQNISDRRKGSADVSDNLAVR